MLHSGIDLHKRTLVLSTIASDGTRVAEAELPTSRAAVRSYFAAHPGPHRAVVESTATGYWLRDLLVPLGVDLKLGHSKYIKAISYAKVKTDAVDSHTLAQLLRNDLIPEGHMISAAHREERDLLRARLRLVSQQVRCRLIVEGLLAQYNVASVGALPPLVQLRVEMLAQQRALLMAHIKPIEQELAPRLVPTPAAQRLQPGHPEQNGRHERMHRTLKADTQRPPAGNRGAQQRMFDRFRHMFNEERPHEALGQRPPATCYQASPRPFPDRLLPLEYPAHWEVRRVSRNGGIRWHNHWVNVSHVLGEEYIGLEETGDGLWDVHFGPVVLGRFHEPLLRIEDANGKLVRNPNHSQPVLPMSLE